MNIMRPSRIEQADNRSSTHYKYCFIQSLPVIKALKKTETYTRLDLEVCQVSLKKMKTSPSSSNGRGSYWENFIVAAMKNAISGILIIFAISE